jgi:hypothetical protein
LNDPDAKKFATAVKKAARHIPITISEKAQDFAAALVVAVEMEWPRVALSMKHSRERGPRSSGGRMGQVFQFTPRGGAGAGAPGPAAPAAPEAQADAQPAAPSPGPIDLGFDLEGETFGP